MKIQASHCRITTPDHRVLSDFEYYTCVVISSLTYGCMGINRFGNIINLFMSNTELQLILRKKNISQYTIYKQLPTKL